MSWSIEDSNNIKSLLQQVLESIAKYKDSPDALKITVNAFGQYCYSLGHERGYNDGQFDAKRGKDERIPIDKIKLN